MDEPGDWIGGFDFPFGLPERFVVAQGWPVEWPRTIDACVRGGKDAFVRKAMAAFVGAKEELDKHRRTDLVAKSHSPLKTNTNPPVGRMFYEGAWRLRSRGMRIPRMHDTGSSKVALEAFPGLLTRQLNIHHYKNDKPASAVKNRSAREAIVQAITSGAHPLGVQAVMNRGSMREAIADGDGDVLDAVLCAVQAAWAARQSEFGLPESFPACEGWIVTAQLNIR